MPKRLLLIEDEEFISFLYKRQFEIAGYEVETAKDGLSGLSSIQQNQYDLVLLDIMLPGMNGIDVLKAAKSTESTKSTPIIMLTNLTQEDVMKKAKDLGASDYWIKSENDPHKIIMRINNYFFPATSSV